MINEKIVFLSYATPDRSVVEEYYKYLSAKGLSVWMDVHNIHGGQNWDFEIRKGLEKSAIIVIFISNNSVNRRGYVQREIRIALDQADEKLLDDIYLIPVLLEQDAPIPSQIKHLQYISAASDDACERVWMSINLQSSEIDRVYLEAQEASGLTWSREVVSEKWDGLPGYDFKYEVMRFDSVDFPDVKRLTGLFRGHAEGALLLQRKDRLDQDPKYYNYGHPRVRRQNVIEYHCREPIICSRVLSVVYDIWLSWAGAAHPNHAHETHNFLVDPLIRLGPIESIFSDPVTALRVIRRHVRRSLLDVKYEDERLLGARDVIAGTKRWSDFENYLFTQRGLEILFAPYHVGPYAFGSQVGIVPYTAIHSMLRPEICSGLGLTQDGVFYSSELLF